MPTHGPRVRRGPRLITTLLGGGVSPLGVALGGWLADGWRAQPVLLVAALAHVALGVRLATLPPLRAVATGDETPGPPQR